MNDLIEKLGKNYEIEKELGRGGMGAVYLATDKRLDRKVAIKVLSLSQGEDSEVSNEEVVKRFQREAKAIAKLNHPNIVNIFDIGEEDGCYYMVMEFLEGNSVGNILKYKKNISPSLAISITMQVCSALDYAHENGITHRDIKPDNIMLSKKGVAKLTDFGIAQLNQDQAKLTQAGSMLGSIMYTSPEQLHDASSVDSRADIYSLGVSLYEMLTGNLPFDGDNVTDIFMKILTKNPESLIGQVPDMPDALDTIISKSLTKDRDKRYQTANDMYNDLALIEGKAPIIKSDELSIGPVNSPNPTNMTSYGGTLITNNGRALFTQTTLKRTSIDKTIIQVLKKNYLWVAILTETLKSQTSNQSDLSQIIAKVSEPSLFGKAFTGSVVIDKAIYLFVYDGFFLGAVNINNNLSGEAVFQTLPANPNLIELRVAEESQEALPVIISSIINSTGKPIHENLDSSLVNLIPLIENLSVEEKFTGYISCYTETNIYYIGFYQGNQIFTIPVMNVPDSNNENVTTLYDIIAKGVVFNAYSVKPVISGPSISNLMKNATVELKYNNPDKSVMYNIVDLGNEEVPIHIVKEAKQNTALSLNLNRESKLNLFDTEVDLLDIVRNSIYYRFSDWLIYEYFYLLNSSGNINSLKYIYSWIPAIEHFKFSESLSGEDGNNYEFSIVFHGQVKGENYKKVLMMARFGDGSKEDVDKFIDETIQVKKKLIKSGDIGGAIYISLDEYSSDALKLFYERTVEPRKGFGLGSLDKLTKYKGFVRIGFGRGFHLNLIEYRKSDHSFNVIAPLLK